MPLENPIIEAANGEAYHYDDSIRSLEDSCFAGDLDFDNLRRHLPLVHDLVREAIYIYTWCTESYFSLYSVRGNEYE